MTALEAGTVELIAPDVLRNSARRVFWIATHNVAATPVVANRAELYERGRIELVDAVHLAAAVEARADLFCTTDDALLRKGRRANTEPTRVVSTRQPADVLES